MEEENSTRNAKLKGKDIRIIKLILKNFCLQTSCGINCNFRNQQFSGIIHNKHFFYSY